MTQQEHLLMIGMFSAMYELTMTLFEKLKSEGLATDYDLAPFHALTQAGFQSGSAGPSIADMYRQSAQAAGVKLSELP